MNSNKMFLSLVPWLVFSVLIHRLGFESAGVAALAAAALGITFIAQNGSGLKLIDAAGVTMFGLLALSCFVGGPATSIWVADYGRGVSALALGAVMLASVPAVPFSEQYARETVPSQYWGTTRFRTVNQKISALWGFLVLVMGVGHLLVGYRSQSPVLTPGASLIDMILNWVLPAALILLGVALSHRFARSTGSAVDLTRPRPQRDERRAVLRAAHDAGLNPSSSSKK